MKKLPLLLLLLLAALPRPAQALQTDDLLALVAMPLAVAAVSEVAGVPQNELADLVATLNNANVAPADFLAMLRYVPAALAAPPVESQPRFVTFVHRHVERGVTGPQLVRVIEQELPTYGVTPEPITVTARRTLVVDRDYVPVVVQQRIARLHEHPHGGPPGQIKKEIGVRTGAEVVHGSHPGHGNAGGRGHGHGHGHKGGKGHGKG